MEARSLCHSREIRYRSFQNEQFVAQLRRHNMALVVADTAGKWPLMEDVTSDFVYVRLHGDIELYASGYTSELLSRWARKIRAWLRGKTPLQAALFAEIPHEKMSQREMFIYFDDDIKVKALFDAMSLARLLKRKSRE